VAERRPAAEPSPGSSMRMLASAIGNHAFTSHVVARQPMTASEQEEEIPAAITGAGEAIEALLDPIAEELDANAPPGSWPGLRARINAVTPMYDQVKLSIDGFAGQRWREAKDDTYIALGLMDTVMAAEPAKNLRMAWGRSYGTLEQIANRSDPERAAAVREKAMEPVKNGIDMIPELERDDGDTEKLLQIRQEGRDVEPDIADACGDDALMFAALQQFRLGLEILRLVTMPVDQQQQLVAGWLDRARFDVTHLDADWSVAYPPGPADEGEVPPPREDPQPPPGPPVAPSPNPLPPPPPPPIP
jgi:hypothetical protein